MPKPMPIQPTDLLELATASDVQLSPDGRLVAYVRTEIDADADAYRSAIWVVPASGGTPVPFTRGPRDWSPRWSPDGRWLAFLSDRDGGHAQLYVLPMAGGEARRLTSQPLGVGEPAWSPDSTRVAFRARVWREPPPADPAERERWTRRPRVVTRAQYKADGPGYTFDAVGHLFVVDVASGAVSVLTQGDAEHAGPAWSPDGRQLAFVRARTGSADYNLFDLWIMDADGGHARRLTEQVGRATSPSWSPDGTLVACFGREQQEPGFGDPVVRVWVAPVQGGTPRCLTAGDRRSVALNQPPMPTPPPIWSADGRTLVCLMADAGSAHVARVFTGDGHVRAVVRGARQVQSVAALEDRLAFCATDWHAPADVYACAPDGSDERRLTDLNGAWRARVALPRVERRTFRSPHGGEIDGWVVHPADGRRPAPLLVDIHGGPHSYAGNAFPLGTLHLFVLAGRGWAALALNPTGSGSYDRAFAHAIRGRWGEHDLPEQLAAVDALVADGTADASRLAVAGYSYGGFMAAWTITHTTRFRAAIVGAPVVNLESFHGTSDIGAWFASWEMCGDLAAHRERYRRLSPVHHLEHVVTPTLIVHGEADERCPIGQGEELFAGLVILGRAPVEFVRYPGQSHAFRGTGRPSYRVDVVRRIVEWVERHAGAPP